MIRTILLVTSIAIACCPAVAATTTYSAVLDQNTYVFGGGGTFNVLTSGSTPLFTANLATDKMVEIIYSAPAGFHFAVQAPPAGSSNPRLSLTLSMGALGSSGVSELGTAAFSGGTGALPTLNLVEFTPFSNGLFRVTAGGGALTGAFTFSSITLSVPVPATYNVNFSGTPPAEVSIIVAAAADIFSNPGPWVSLEADASAVPEPGSAVLILSGAVALALAYRVKTAVRVARRKAAG